MNIQELHQRKSDLQRDFDDKSDQITEYSNAIEVSSRGLQAAKSDYLIEPGTGQLVTALKRAQADFDKLVSNESTAIRERLDLENALHTVHQRIAVIQAQDSKEQKQNIAQALPAKMQYLEGELLSAVSRMMAAMQLSGLHRFEPGPTVTRLIIAHRDEYHVALNHAKTALTEELSEVAA